jgi:glutamine amidotransferase
LTTILDYGMGNLRSVEKAVAHLGFPVRVLDEVPEDTERLIVPGVGAFGAAMERLASRREAIREFAASGKPLLGICLGQQLLFDWSEEHGRHEGLGLLRGSVRYLPRDMGLKVPHMGWSPLTVRIPEGPMAKLGSGEHVFFVHSLHTVCEDPHDVVATAEYGLPFAAAVRRENVWGTQFHPEKSGDVGLRILRSFLEC